MSIGVRVLTWNQQSNRTARLWKSDPLSPDVAFLSYFSLSTIQRRRPDAAFLLVARIEDDQDRIQDGDEMAETVLPVAVAIRRKKSQM